MRVVHCSDAQSSEKAIQNVEQHSQFPAAIRTNNLDIPFQEGAHLATDRNFCAVMGRTMLCNLQAKQQAGAQ
jgi:hypothetical protein